MADLHLTTFLLALLAGAVRVGTPFLFVSLGECLTEKGGRINLGLEGILVVGAMTGYAVSYMTGSPWLGVLAAAGAGLLLGLLHGMVCSLPRVNDIAFGIALILLGTGLAFSSANLLFSRRRLCCLACRWVAGAAMSVCVRR